MKAKEIEKRLSELKDLGYVKVGYISNENFFDFLLIHRDWVAKDWNFLTYFDQAAKDLDKVGFQTLMTIEAVPLEVYRNERTGGPDHKIVFEL
jgi:hypothetical protein